MVNEEDAKKILIEIILGYYDLFKSNIVHRNLNADNIMLHYIKEIE